MSMGLRMTRPDGRHMRGGGGAGAGDDLSRTPGCIGSVLRMTAGSGVGMSVAEAKEVYKDRIIDGKRISAEVRAEVREDALAIARDFGVQPGLAVVIVGSRPDSQTYVRNKVKACEECGIKSFKHELDDSASTRDLTELMGRLNADPAIHGILVQLPLPEHVDETTVLDAISADKDVDGFQPLVMGRLAMRGRDSPALPCTPSGVMEMLRRQGVAISGKQATVVGRSNIVGIPMALMLLKADASVRIVHSKSAAEDFKAAVAGADILVSAAGQPGLIPGDWIKDGAVVVDVGINAVPDVSKKAGYRLTGDVAFAAAAARASLITPVPGGVGPMTIAMLLSNTVKLARARLSE